MTTLLLALLAQPADAFCGTYVGKAGAELYNHSSQVVLVRQGNRTTLTLANDYDGDATDFALVIPVPEVLREEDVQTVDARLISRVDAYSSPRLVEYTCDELWDMPTADAGSSSAACGSPLSNPPPIEVADGVFIESSFEAGEYDIAVLSAEQSSGLFGWLDDNGFEPHADAEALLSEYIDAGMRFLTAKVRVDASGHRNLSPLQLTYTADDLALPIRIGTASSPGTQDLLLYTLTDTSEGSVAIANYPRRVVDDECMAVVDAESLGEYYAGTIDRLFEDDGSAWTTEYSWSPHKCDPCVGEPLDDDLIRKLGWQGDPSNAHFTRLHARYDKGAATEDLLLYTTGVPDQKQIRYIRYAEELEASLPVCGLGFVDNPGSCPDNTDWRRRERQSRLNPLWLVGLLAPGIALFRRRDSHV